MTSYSPMFDDQPLIVASRASALAVAQSRIVLQQLAPLPGDIQTLTTKGDRILDRSLADAGGKGLFIKELERALIAGNCDIAVHSMKDMETHFAEGTMIAAVLPREDRRDALVGPYATLADLPQGAVVGTASVRRKALLLHARPDLRIELLRGNVNSRLAALAEGRYDAIILAMAGLRRLQIAVPHTPLAADEMPSAAAQGALAIQARLPEDARSKAVLEACAELTCQKTLAEVTAERALLGQLDGSCHTPIAASATLDDAGILRLDGMVLKVDGSEAHRAVVSGKAGEAEALGHQLADDLLVRAGGRGFLA